MEDSENTFVPPGSYGMGKQPVVLIAQFMRSTSQMRHIDEVFVWLSNALVRYLDLPVVQFWTTTLNRTGQDRAELRAITTQDGSMPQEVYLNNQVQKTVERLFCERRGTRSRFIQNFFSPMHASLCTVYDLHYWTGYFLDSDALFPSTETSVASQRRSKSFTIVMSLFTVVPLSADQVRVMDFILKQAMRIIVNKRFQTFRHSWGAMQENPVEDDPSAVIADIIPVRAQDVKGLQAANPLANVSIIADRRARRLYSAVDGSRSVAELAQVTRLAQQELIKALCYLFQHEKIEFYTAQGEQVEQLPPVLCAS